MCEAEGDGVLEVPGGTGSAARRARLRGSQRREIRVGIASGGKLYFLLKTGKPTEPFHFRFTTLHRLGSGDVGMDVQFGCGEYSA